MREELLIIRFGEVALKGKNKSFFERKMIARIKKVLKGFDKINVTREEGLVFIREYNIEEREDIIKEVSKVFGIASISPALIAKPFLEDIYDASNEFMTSVMEKEDVKTFKIEAKRADKNFPVKSPDLARMVGGAVLKFQKVLSVDVKNPDVYLHVDVRRDKALIYRSKIVGFGGLPLGTNGKGLVLLSGGIDSPVAAWMMAKRGMRIEAIHFHSYPYTSQRARDKVQALAEKLAIYCDEFKMHVVNLLPIQEAIVKDAPEEEMTIHTRRFMMKIAEKIAEKNNCKMLITGESLGQVASQTTESIVATDNAVNIPVMRPLIAMDKIDIMEIAKDIDTYEISILPYEDCCTVFLPKRPVTRPKLDKILESEQALDTEKLIENALENVETVKIVLRD